ncbi:hypothetical protein [Streptomyces europaeiscabiei]|uniref:hypothetical protein n=1 Tax=Streptomyces europaeiscabiei TaxID=146819 RepID=UPI002E280EDF|nr:hypothetical protein [Streptomyces europaeiscabiei]
MRRPLAVERLGQVNLFAQSLDAELNLQQDVFGARVLRRWGDGLAGSRHALVLIHRTGVETFAPTTPGGAVALRSDGNGPGWESLQWQVSSLGDAVTALREHGVRVGEDAAGRAFVRPQDMHGLAIGLTDRRAESHDRDLVDRKPTFRSDDHALGLVGGATVKVVAAQPEKAAADLAALVGREAYAVERRHLNMAGHGVRFDDHAVEYVGSATGSRADLAGGHLVERGERIFCLTFTVRDLLAARTFLVGRDVRFQQFGRHSLLLAPVDAGGARIEITDTD